MTDLFKETKTFGLKLYFLWRLSINDVTHLEEEGGSLFSKIGDKKGEEKIKNLKTCMGDVSYGR